MEITAFYDLVSRPGSPPSGVVEQDVNLTTLGYDAVL